MAFQRIEDEREEYSRMRIDWRENQIQRGGTRAMREHYRAYLDQQMGETDANFRRRGRTSTYWPFAVPAIYSYAAKVVQSEVVLRGPDELAMIEDDLDGKGNDITRLFEQFIFNQYFWGGNRRLVDSPVEPSLNLGEAMMDRSFPYLVLVPPPDFYNWKYDGRERLTEARIKISFEASNPLYQFDLQGKDIWRVYYPDRIEDYGQPKMGGQATLLRTYPYWGLTDYLPADTAYGDRLGPHYFQSEIQDVFYMNAEHFEITSQLKVARKFGLDRILHLDGVKKEEVEDLYDDLAEGAQNMVLFTPGRTRQDQSASVSFVQSDNKGAENARADRMELQEAMVARTVQVLMPRTGTVTATEVAIDTADEVSSLAGNVTKGEIFFENGLRDLLRMMRPSISQAALDEVEVEADKNFGLSLQVQKELEELEKARARGDITAEAYLQVLQDRGVLPADMSIPDIMAAPTTEGEMPVGRDGQEERMAM